MGNIKEEAQQYEPPKTKNISDLDRVPVSLELEEREGTKKDGKVFRYNVVVLNGEDYRVPNSILKSLKAIIKEKPDLEEFKVAREGEGLKTEYTVIPLDPLN